MRISLIQTSQNRKDELARFVKSLNAQVGIDFGRLQLVFVDQEDNAEVYDELDKRIDFTYIKHEHCSLSCARNIGLRYATGDYVGFPDDDCWYETDVLKRVFAHFADGHAGVVARGEDESGKPTNDFPQNAQRLTLYNHCGAISYTIFLKRVASVTFDENIGVGSPYRLSSGEETDYLLNVMRAAGTMVYYDPHIIVHHPASGNGNFRNDETKQYEYARGWGYVLRKHKYPVSIVLKSFVRPLGGSLLSLFQFNVAKAKHSFLLLRGRLEGYFYKL